jgi:hypothetical protein
MGLFPLTTQETLLMRGLGQFPLTVRGTSLTAEPWQCPSSPHRANKLLTTNHTFAGRSASRRMYHGNQCWP